MEMLVLFVNLKSVMHDIPCPNLHNEIIMNQGQSEMITKRLKIFCDIFEMLIFLSCIIMILVYFKIKIYDPEFIKNYYV